MINQMLVVLSPLVATWCKISCNNVTGTVKGEGGMGGPYAGTTVAVIYYL